MENKEKKPKLGLLDKLADLLFFAMVICAAIPENFVDSARVSEIPVGAIFFSAATLFSITRYFRNHRRPSLYFSLTVLSLIFMSVFGLANADDTYFSYRSFGIDTVLFSGVLGGITWAEQRSPEMMLKAFLLWSSTAAVLTVLTVGGLHFDVIAPAPDAGRTLVFSLFSAAFVLLMVAPYLMAFARIRATRMNTTILLVASLILLALAFLVAIFTATRSFFLLALACCLVCARILFAWNPFFVGGALLGATIISTVYIVETQDVQGSLGLLGERIETTDVENEGRLLETQMMFKQMTGWDILVGKGFGSRFLSVIGQDSVAIAPHIGVLTFMLKGGCPGFLLFVIIPLIIGLIELLRPRTTPITLACSGGVLIYLVLSSLSGGWQLLHLFLYGSFLAALISARRRSASVIACPKKLRTLRPSPAQSQIVCES